MSRIIGFVVTIAAAFASGFLVHFGIAANDLRILHLLRPQCSHATQVSAVSEARMLLARSDWTRAKSTLVGVPHSGTQSLASDPADRATIQAFLGIIAEQQNRPAEASRRFTEAAAHSSTLGQATFFQCLASAVEPAISVPLSGASTLLSLIRHPLGLATVAVLEAGDAGRQPDHSKSQKVLLTLVTEARSAFKQSASLENKIKLLTA